MPPKKLSSHPVHLGLNATAKSEPEFTGDMAWYAAYGDRHSQDDPEGRLVSMHSFTEPWTTWEMHPHGSEDTVGEFKKSGGLGLKLALEA